MGAIGLLAGDTIGGGVDFSTIVGKHATSPTKSWFVRLPASPQAGSCLFLGGAVDYDVTVTGIGGIGNIGVGFSLSGMTAANFAGLDDGGILFMGTWQNFNPIFGFNWHIPKGARMTVSKNQASAVDFLIWYVAHVG